MKKLMEWLLFAVIVIVLPGGALLAVRKLARQVKAEFLAIAVVAVFSGCIPYFKYEVKEPGKNGAMKYTVARGWTTDMPAAMLAASASDYQRAEAKCVESRGVAECFGYAGGGYGGASGLPAGYTVGTGQTTYSLIRTNERISTRSQASGDSSLAEVVRGQKETNIYLKALANSQEKFQRALIKRKRGKK